MYKSLVEENSRDMATRDALMESLRLVHQRIVDDRERPVTSGITRTMRDNSDVHDNTVRSWCRVNGVVMPRSGRVTNALRDQYREAHGMTVQEPQKPQVIPVITDVPVATIREWCRQNGVQVGLKGKLKPEAIRAYQEAHGE